MTEGLEKFQNYIGGSFVDASDERTFDSLDPYAGEPWASIPEAASRTLITPSPRPAAPSTETGGG